MPFELIVFVKKSGVADVWSTPATKLSVPVSTRKDTYKSYSVVAVDDSERTVKTPKEWERAARRYPVKYAISAMLEDAHDAESYVEALESIHPREFSPIYRVRNESVLQSIPEGSHVSVADTVVSSFSRLKQYHVWSGPTKTYRRQWLEFCEMVTYGTIPVGVLIVPVPKLFLQYVVRRGLSNEYSPRGIEWNEETSSQNIIAHWEAISNQYERLSRAGRQSEMGNLVSEYGLIGSKADPLSEVLSAPLSGS
jgi:hypothetical protein